MIAVVIQDPAAAEILRRAQEAAQAAAEAARQIAAKQATQTPQGGQR